VRGPVKVEIPQVISWCTGKPKSIMEDEGYTVIQKGKKYVGVNFENYLATL
jgi:hypothetical protein